MAPPREGRFDGFVHVEDGQLVDGRGRPLVLRGVGLGNWLLREGYMWKFEPAGPLSSRQIETFVTELVGPERGARFWRDFHDRFITEADIAAIAAEGFDHVRVPINARVVQTDDGELIEDGLRLIDNVIAWCRAHGLWVILDLHGAPGGQTGTNIDDSPNGVPELFTSAPYTKLTIDLWRALAERYSGETVVAAYDLLNEPLPNDYQHLYADELVQLYKDITAAIREVDSDHAIVYEGTHWSTNWDIFTEVWDPNSILQCHKYWSPPDRPSVQRFVDRGRELDLPVYMGETGENNAPWLQAAFQLYDDCGMSWNFWPWKKIETLTSPCSVDAPPGWDAIVAYGRGIGPRPAADDAWATLTELLDAFAVANCTYRTDVVNAILRRAPLRLAPWAFSFRGRGVSYETTGAVPLEGFRGDDDVTLVTGTLDEAGAPPFWHNAGASRGADEDILVRLGPRDWVAYDVEIRDGGDVRVVVVLEPADNAAALTLTLGETAATDVLAVGGTMTASVAGVPAGVNVLRVQAGDAPVLLRWIDVTPV
ncbi:MAG: endoglucanase [Frankiaceae bacterium]|nr:endoglucanase [Frankiaceae bacterium]